MGLPGSYPVPQSGAYTGPQQAFISDLDIQRIAEAVMGIIVAAVQTLVIPIKNQNSALQKKNLELRREIDDVLVYNMFEPFRV